MQSGPKTAHRFFATAAKGTEVVLAEELRGLSAAYEGEGCVEEARGGVAFEGPLELGYRVCLWSRVASRVLLPLATFEAPDPDALYRGVRSIAWLDHLGPEQTFAVDAVGRRSAIENTRYAALKTKDAVVDTVREACGSRPDVDTQRPDVRLHVYLEETRATASIDLAGEGLHRRGIGRSGALAPLKENLASALLLMADWPKLSGQGAPLVDPMCGSATLLVEAAWMALDVAPGIQREHLGFVGWRGHDAAMWERLLSEARDRRAAGRGKDLRIYGWDGSEDAVTAASRNASQAGVQAHVTIARRALSDCAPPEGVAEQVPRGLLITNPPYGERLGEAGALGPLYEQLGDVLRRRFLGWSTWVLSGNPALSKRIGLKPKSRRVVFNGPIECRFLELPIADRKVEGDRGPGWRKAGPDADMLRNRLRKNRKRLKGWAKQGDVGCYRLYDADMPEYNLAIDWYDGLVRIEEYDRPRSVDPRVAEQHLSDAMIVVPEVLGVDPDRVTLRVRRRRQKGEQYHPLGDAGRFREAREGDLRFLVNLSDYLDTGLFLDDRELRSMVRGLSEGKDFLNLFAYTCTASVAAAVGGARSTTSVDLSSTYLDWGRRNFALNGVDVKGHRFVRSDCLEWLARRPASEREKYDLAFVGPPTYSRSKATDSDFDVQRDHVRLIQDVARLLRRDGQMIFTTNLRTFRMDEPRLGGLVVEEITKKTTPRDFERSPQHRAFLIRG